MAPRPQNVKSAAAGKLGPFAARVLDKVAGLAPRGLLWGYETRELEVSNGSTAANRFADRAAALQSFEPDCQAADIRENPDSASSGRS